MLEMRKMKDSGIEWIGEVPERWEIQKLKYYATVTSGEILSKDEYVFSGDIPVIGSNGKIGTTYKSNNHSEVITTGRVGTIGTAQIVQDAWITDNALIIKSHSISRPFLTYVIPNFDFKFMLSGTAQPLITATKLKNQYIPVPSSEVQDKLVQYLNTQIFNLSHLISQVCSSIELYKKLKQAVITQAVTKGVRGEREMKDSGVEWIGAIPKDWEIKRLKSFCTIVDCKNRTPDVFPDGKYTVVRTTCIKDCSFSYEGSYQTDTTNFKAWTLKGQPHKGDIFFTREAPVGEACLVPNADNLCMGQRVMFFRPEDNSDARYIMYSIYGPLVREYIASKNSGSTVGHLKLGQVACIPIFYCPPLEQKEIADYLDAKCAEIDGLVAKKEQLVKELESYKKSLIYEVVTGKREV